MLCSVSGKWSGNMSGKTKEDECHNVGHSCGHWQSHFKYKDKKRTFKDCMGSDFVYKGKSDSKSRRANASCTETGWDHATCDHIMNGEDYYKFSIGSDEVRILHIGLCAYMNAEAFGSQYHISKEEAQGLCRGAMGKAVFVKDGNRWTKEQCREHLEMLFIPA